MIHRHIQNLFLISLILAFVFMPSSAEGCDHLYFDLNGENEGVWRLWGEEHSFDTCSPLSDHDMISSLSFEGDFLDERDRPLHSSLPEKIDFTPNQLKSDQLNDIPSELGDPLYYEGSFLYDLDQAYMSYQESTPARSDQHPDDDLTYPNKIDQSDNREIPQWDHTYQDYVNFNLGYSPTGSCEFSSEWMDTSTVPMQGNRMLMPHLEQNDTSHQQIKVEDEMMQEISFFQNYTHEILKLASERQVEIPEPLLQKLQVGEFCIRQVLEKKYGEKNMVTDYQPELLQPESFVNKAISHLLNELVESDFTQIPK